MTRPADDIIEAWNNGDLGINDADKINDVDGFTVQAEFHCEQGPVILTFSLDEELSYKPDPGNGDGMTQFDITEA